MLRVGTRSQATLVFAALLKRCGVVYGAAAAGLDAKPWCTLLVLAGRGIIHSEMPAVTSGDLHGFQLWINLPKKVGAGCRGIPQLAGPSGPRFLDTAGHSGCMWSGRQAWDMHSFWDVFAVLLQ
jgi:hypothetical protein